MKNLIYNEPKIIFFLDDTSSSNGGARPLINWARFMSDNSILLSLRKFNDITIENLIVVNSIDEAINVAKKYEIIVVSDNSIKRGLKIAENSGLRLVVYCQVPFGMHSLGLESEYDSPKNRLLYGVSKSIPFRILTVKYRRNLKKANLIIANSLNMHILLNFVYGILDSAILYPPVASNTFARKKGATKDSITIFIGREGDLNNINAIKKIVDVAERYNLKINILGSYNLDNEDYLKNHKITFLKGISDEQLVDTYNKSFVTICIQQQEYFGYVPVESLLCGTPSITLYHHNASEVNHIFKKYIITSNILNLTDDLTNLIDAQMKDYLNINIKYVSNLFSIEYSATQLLLLLKK